MTNLLALGQMNTKDSRARSGYRWLMLAVAALTGMLVYAVPALSLSVLFPEISVELGLDIVQVGVIWAVSSFTGVFVVLVGGLLGDRFGTRRMLILACILSGIIGGLRGTAGSYYSFLAISFLLGLVQPVVPINLHKMAGEWFSSRQLGLATAVISTGFAAGLMFGSLFSASVLSPATGGWQGVLVLYGLVGIIMGGIWFVIHPKQYFSKEAKQERSTLRQGVGHVARLKSIWLVGLGAMGFWACTRGLTGYLPTYLRGIGWSANQADVALALFYAFSLMAAIPFALLTDRYKLRRHYLIFAALMMAAGTGLMTIAEGALVLVAVAMAGVVFDGFMAILQATVLQIRGVGIVFAGTALGFVAMLREFGGVYSPPIGNGLSAYGASVPFVFWSAMALLGSVALIVYLMKGWDR